jgi:uncharacterized protein
MKPQDLFDRDEEWEALDRHVIEGRARFGVVTGRRRVGKTFLLRRLAEQHRGLFVSCLIEEREPALRRFAEALGRHHGVPLGPPVDWAAAFAQATSGPLAVPLLIIDELPYLLAHSPEIESVLQHVVDESRDRAGTRIIVSGSSLAVMGGLLGEGRPLRGRAELSLNLQPFDYRTAAAYWGIDDPSLAFRVHAVLGGSPGYRPLAVDPPATVRGFDRWLKQSILNPAAALYREDSYLLSEDRRLAERSGYSSILRAVAGGERRPSRIAGRVGKAQTSLSHAFAVLVEAGFLRSENGLLSGRDPLYYLADPVITFLNSCVDPWRPLIEDGRRDDAWRSASPTWHAQVLGPHLELLARQWASRFAPVEMLDGPAGLVGRAEIADAAGRVAREIDVAVLSPGEKPGTSAQVRVIGEVKLTADVDAIAHLDRCSDLLEQRGNGRPTRLLVVFEHATAALLRAAARRADVELVSLDRLYVDR